MATATFYAIGDVPYTDEQAIDLAQQMDAIPASADFVIHVGDIRSAVDNTRCTLTEYQNVARILQRSRVPVFLVPGDNEWNDCPNRAQAWTFWLDTFTAFESSVDRWNPPLVMERMPNRPETFAFIHRRTLFVGLNLVGGQVHDAVEWQVRLTTQLAWLKDLLLRHYGLPTVLFGHANPVANHAVFFNGLRDFVRDDFGEIPFLYLNGDRHRYVQTVVGNLWATVCFTVSKNTASRSFLMSHFSPHLSYSVTTGCIDFVASVLFTFIRLYIPPVGSLMPPFTTNRIGGVSW
jgi:hypothetical protein